jgi:hypothetical protein
VYPDSRHRAACLTPGALALGATVQRLLQQALPEPLSPLGVVRRKLDERQLRTGHLSNLLSMLESTKEIDGEMHSRLRPELGTPNPTQFGLDAVRAALGAPPMPSPTEAVAILRARVAEFAHSDGHSNARRRTVNCGRQFPLWR